MNVPLLKGKMTAAGYTQRSLAIEMNQSKNTVNRKVNGVTPMTTDDILMICTILHIESDAEKIEIFLSNPS